MAGNGRLLLRAMAAGLALRLAVIPFLYREWLDPFVLDHWAFGRVARSLVAGHGYGNTFADTGNSALLAPVYTFCLAAIFRILGIYSTASIFAAAAFNSVVSALTCVPVFLIALRSFGQRTARWSAWAWALSPYGIYFSADWLWSTCLVTFLLALLFLTSIRLEKRPAIVIWLGFGLLCGIAALTEPVILAVAPALGALSCFRLRQESKSWIVPGLTAALAAVIAISPWIARNYLAFHRFIPVRDGFGLELWLGNNGYSARWVNSALHPNHNDAELREYEQSGELTYMAHKQRQALDYIGGHKAWFAGMTVRRILYMWTGFWSFDKTYLEQEPLDPPNILVAVTLNGLALAGLLVAFRERLGAAPRFALALLFFPLAYYITHAEAYYFRPLDPLIAILAIFAVVRFRERRKAAHG
jgi:4-amino-4-deoxy-L-arabinose transferase-like glycosyltransferase